MPLYQYRCRECGYTAEVFDHASTLGLCPGCSAGELKRDYTTVQLAPVMQEHYNPSVNGPVSSVKKLNEHFKRASDEYSERTGIEAKFSPIDPKDVGATDEGLDSTNRQRRSMGLKEVSVE